MRRVNLFILFIITLATCTEDEVTSRNYHRVKTHPVIVYNEEGVLLKGEITFKNSSKPIIDYGFEVSPNRTLISLGAKEAAGTFESLITGGFETGKKYQIRAYAKSPSETTYGEIQEFTSLGSLSPKIISFNKTLGTWRDTIRITGENLGPGTEVFFHDVKAKTILKSPTSLETIVPNNLKKHKSNLVLSFLGNVSTSDDFFELSAPTITSITPADGTANTLVTITGTNFNPVNNEVFFGNTKGQITLNSPTLLKVYVPIGISDSENIVRVQTGEVELSATTLFTNHYPSISTITPSEAKVSDIITLSGIFFGSDITSNTVRFDNTVAEIISATTTEIRVRIPENLLHINPEITVEYNNQISTLNNSLKITEPIITAVSPTDIKSRGTITITGNNFYSSILLVIDDQPLNFNIINENTIEATCPVYFDSFNPKLKLSFADHSQNINLQSSWRKIATHPENFIYPLSFTYNNKVYCGFDQGNGNTLWEYDPSVNLWKDFATFPTGEIRQGTPAFVLGNKLYMAYDYYSFYCLNLETKEWTKKSDVDGAYSSGFSLNGKGYFLSLGYENGYVYEYNEMLDTWSYVMEIPFSSPTAYPFEINGKVYLIDTHDQIRSIDPVGKTWELLGKIPSPDGSFAFVTPSGNNIVFGYRNGTLNKFDLGSRKWSKISDIMCELNYIQSHAVSLNNQIYIISGIWYNSDYGFNDNASNSVAYKTDF